MNKPSFGKLRLSVKGTGNGSGFDVFYDFGQSFDFVEGTSRPEFYFIQPWMQFPSRKYTEECMRVSIELVRRFNEFEELEQLNEHLRNANTELTELVNKLKEKNRIESCEKS